MKTIFALIAVAVALATAYPTPAQQEPKHAPSVEMCRADAAVWYSLESANEYSAAQVKLLRDGIPNRTEFAKLSIPELFARIYEMIDCEQVDDERNLQYFEAMTFYNEIVGDRTLRFVIRHGLMEQLKKEDAAGKR